MAYKKTGGRSVTVQPTGMPDLSGFFDAARQMQEIGNVANSIGTDIRRREYNDLLRQAEVDGSTAGAVYKKDKNGQMVLQPLVNFDYEKATQLYNEGDQKTILDAYRKSATRTYVSAASNDIDLAAENALDQNPDDPNGIRGALGGYLDGLSELDPQLRAALTPKAVQAFGVAENRAFALQQKNAKENAIYQNSSAYQALSVEKGKIISSFDEDEAGNEAKLARLREIESEQAEIVDTLKINEVSDLSITKLSDVDRTVVAARVGTNYIKKIYAANGPIAAHQAARDLEEEAKLNPNLDERVIGEIARQSVSTLIAMDNLKITEDNKLRKSIYNDLYKGIVVDGLDIGSVMLDPNSDFFKLEGTQQATLLSVAKASQQEVTSVLSTQNQRIFVDNTAVLDNPEIHTLDQFQAAGKAIADMRDSGAVGVTYKDLVDTKMKFRKGLLHYTKGEREATGSMLFFELDKNTSSFVNEPSYYATEDFKAKLEQLGVIGPEGHYKTRSQFDKAISVYTEAYQKRSDDVASANKAERKIQNNIPPSSAEVTALIKEKGFDKVRVKNESGADVLVDLDLFSDDEAVVAASIDAISNFSVESRGLLHPEAKLVFDRAPYTMQNADKAMRIMGQIISGIRAKTPGTTRETAISMFIAGNDLDEKTVGFIRSVEKIGIENAMQAYAGEAAVNKNRSITNFLSNNGYDKETFFKETFQKALEDEKFFTLIQTTISPSDKQMLNDLANEAGVSNIEGAIIKDPFIKDSIMNIFYDKVSSKSEGSPVTHMQDTIRQIGKRIGVQKNASTGKLEFVTNPILKIAQSTVPSVAGSSVVTLTNENIMSDVRDRFVNGLTGQFDLMKPPTKAQEYMYGMFERLNSGTLDQTTMHFHANETYGGDPTYSVYLRDEYDRVHLVTDTYSYDFKDSTAYKETYQEVIGQLKTDKAKQFWSMYGLMDKSLVQSTFQSMERNRNDKSLNGLINAWNSFNDATAFSISSGASGTVTAKETSGYFGRAREGDINVWSVDTLTEEEKNDFFYIVDRFLTLGWR